MSVKDRLIYLPLGGAGEIGMNCYVYGYGPEGEERLIVVDLGVTFPDMDSTPGVDLIMADVAWLEENADRIEREHLLDTLAGMDADTKQDLFATLVACLIDPNSNR